MKQTDPIPSGRGVGRLLGPTLLRALTAATLVCAVGTPAAARQAAARKVAAKKAAAQKEAPAGDERAPTDEPKAVTFETIGLRPAELTALAVSKADANVLYLGSASGSVFVSLDGGRSWSESVLIQLGDGPGLPRHRNASRKGSLLSYFDFFPQDAVGLGAPGNSIGSVRVPKGSFGGGNLGDFGFAGSVYSGWFFCGPAACFPLKMKSHTYFYLGDIGGGRLSPGGSHGLPRLAGGPAAVNEVAIDPRAGTSAFAATAQGVFRTRDGGTSWTRVFVPPLSSDKSVGAVWFDGQRLLVEAGGERYVSRDGGESFELASGALADAERPERDLAGWELAPEGLVRRGRVPMSASALTSARETMAIDPGLSESILACLEYLGAAPDEHAAIADHTRWLALIPNFSLFIGYMAVEGEGRVIDPLLPLNLPRAFGRRTDNSRVYFAVGFDWKLDRVALPRGEAGRGKKVQGLQATAARLSTEIRLLYSERLRVLAEIERGGSQGQLAHENLRLRLDYLTARLDGLTGGLWTSSPEANPGSS